jgi:hypothetical protein
MPLENKLWPHERPLCSFQTCHYHRCRDVGGGYKCVVTDGFHIDNDPMKCPVTTGWCGRNRSLFVRCLKNIVRISVRSFLQAPTYRCGSDLKLSLFVVYNIDSSKTWEKPFEADFSQDEHADHFSYVFGEWNECNVNCRDSIQASSIYLENVANAMLGGSPCHHGVADNRDGLQLEVSCEYIE